MDENELVEVFSTGDSTEAEIVRALRRVLSAHGYTVLSASSGEAALEIVAQHRPDLVLLDLLLPGMSGLEVCRRVRATSNVPIIVLSVISSSRYWAGKPVSRSIKSMVSTRPGSMPNLSSAPPKNSSATMYDAFDSAGTTTKVRTAPAA